ncbi:unnamed protein product [Rotaria magnacalcarata]|uniref:BTB domain-containing protein n=1 Tax=Rotaria magnacalcarata TaxID=392030 RepID=A0A819T661_9BILA|nr:unnamed protein product [Rotaria magnacalcarata]CAF1513739.1 unnamed protein product [Rotaria magnacalcarata]CAF2074365.1 unnamed protein product [Rotaria magnacalcarata]CAF2104581.1 unnamed protein product [Rotaria magnacalcarata]CAF2219705.1 unnamed protein product [Rotaria magnacalcarata]
MPRKVGNILLNVEGRYFQVDRHLLASQSIYFRVLFRSKSKRDKHGAILIPGNADRFGLIIDYLTGEYQLTNGQLESIIADGATLYHIPSLVYLSQFKTKYEARDKQRVQEVQRTMQKMDKLNREITNLEEYINHMRREQNY